MLSALVVLSVFQEEYKFTSKKINNLVKLCHWDGNNIDKHFDWFKLDIKVQLLFVTNNNYTNSLNMCLAFLQDSTYIYIISQMSCIKSGYPVT